MRSRVKNSEEEDFIKKPLKGSRYWLSSHLSKCITGSSLSFESHPFVTHIGIPKIRSSIYVPSHRFGRRASIRPVRNIVVSRRARTEERRRFYPGRGFQIDEIRPHRRHVNPCQNRISNVQPEKQALSFQVFRHARLVLCVDRYVARSDDTNPSDRDAY